MIASACFALPARSGAPEVDGRADGRRHASQARYGEHVLVQLVYTIWFSERRRAARSICWPGASTASWRVTLAPDGEPILYDFRFMPAAVSICSSPPRALEQGPRRTDSMRQGVRAAFGSTRKQDERVVLSIASATITLSACALSARRAWCATRSAVRRAALAAARERHASLHPPRRHRAGHACWERFFGPMGIASAEQCGNGAATPRRSSGAGISTTRSCSSGASNLTYEEASARRHPEHAQGAVAVQPAPRHPRAARRAAQPRSGPRVPAGGAGPEPALRPALRRLSG